MRLSERSLYLSGLEAVAKRKNSNSHQIWRPKSGFPQTQVNGSPEYVRSSCEASLKRLDVEYIDLYYQHRVDTKVPIEETVSDSHALSITSL